MKLTNLFSTDGDPAAEDSTLPHLAEIDSGQTMNQTGLVMNPPPRHRIDRALGRIYRLFMKLEDINDNLDKQTIDPIAAKAKYEEIKISFNRYTTILRGHDIPIPQNREEWLKLFNTYDIVR